VTGAQRLHHGSVTVLKTLTDIEVLGLTSIDFDNGNSTDLEKRCRNWCYSNIYCEYWQFGSTGCWVDAAGEGVASGVANPLVLGVGAKDITTSSVAQLLQGGEYIQHYCPAAPTTTVPPTTTSSNAASAASSGKGESSESSGESSMPGESSDSSAGENGWTWGILGALLGLSVLGALVAACSQMCNKKKKKVKKPTRPVNIEKPAEPLPEVQPLVAYPPTPYQITSLQPAYQLAPSYAIPTVAPVAQRFFGEANDVVVCGCV